MKKENTIKENYSKVRYAVAQAAHKSGRNSSEIRLVVVSKKQPLDIIESAISNGIVEFGENYAEEGAGKIQSLHAPNPLIWHMIGHIQSRKANLVARHFDFIHSIDSVKIATLINDFAGRYGRSIPVLLECNVSGEGSKNGFAAATHAEWENLLADFEKIADFPNIQVRGLMTMPPYYLDPEQTRTYFTKLRECRDFLQSKIRNVHWSDLSMGTSVDYPVAVEEGATIIRVGTAILGSREKIS